MQQAAVAAPGVATPAAGFHVFSPTHAGALMGVALVILALVTSGRRWRGSPNGRRLEQGLAAAILVLRGAVVLWNLRPSHFDPGSSLPLQICDLAAVAAAIALVHPARWARALAYFWGLALSMQALLTPDLGMGPGELGFWVFWLHHALIEGAALYVVFVQGYRPRWLDLGVAVGLGVLYVAVLFPLDAFMGYNYGYIGRAQPGQPTLIDFLGPWPGRVLSIMALGAGAMTVLLLPWLFAARRSPALPSSSTNR